MVATSGGIFIASVCQCYKINGSDSGFVCESVDLLDPRDPKLSTLIQYARNAAHALGSVLGPVHMELIWEPNGPDAPVMIEAGACQTAYRCSGEL